MSEKLQRVLKIADLIQTGRHNVESLSVACRVHRRTVLRDLKLLRNSGIPINYDKNREQFSILEGFSPPTSKDKLTLPEAVALTALCWGAGGKAVVPLLETAQNASSNGCSETTCIGHRLQVV